jgi:hypothetical protein
LTRTQGDHPKSTWPDRSIKEVAVRAGLAVAAILAVALAGNVVGREAVLVEPGSSLQVAIDQAAPGSTLILASDAVYDGTLTIEKDVALVGEQPLGALPTLAEMVQGTAGLLPQSPPQIVGGIVVQSGSVTLQGVSVTCNGDSPGVYVRGGELTLTGCRIFRAAGPGLAVEPGATATAVGVTVFGSSGYGVVVEPGAICTLSYCCVWANHDGGIQCSGPLSASDTVILGSGQILPSGPANGLTIEEGGAAWLERSWIGWSTGYGVSAVDSGAGLRGVENVVLPSFGPELNALGAYSEGDMPDSFLADGYEVPVEFWWHFAGQVFEVDVSLWVPLARDMQEWLTPRARVDARTDRSLSLLADRLSDLASSSGFVEDADIVEFVGSFIGQNTAYDYARVETEEPGYHSPVTTLVRKSGVCRDYALLAATLLDEMGFDTAYVSLPPVGEGRGHAVVGVCISGSCDPAQAEVPATCGQHVDFDGKRYALLDTGSPTPRLGDVPLTSWGEPEVTPTAALYGDHSLVQATAEILATIPADPESPAERAFVRVTFRNTGAAPSPQLRARLQIDSPWRWLGVLAPGESRAITLVLDSTASGYPLLVVEWAGEDFVDLGVDVILLWRQ